MPLASMTTNFTNVELLAKQIEDEMLALVLNHAFFEHFSIIAKVVWDPGIRYGLGKAVLRTPVLKNLDALKTRTVSKKICTVLVFLKLSSCISLNKYEEDTNDMTHLLCWLTNF